MSNGTHSYAVVVLGSSNIDLVTNVERFAAPGETVFGNTYNEHPGGKGLNQAIAASRSGADTAFITALGSDGAGDALQRLLTQEGVAGYITNSSAPTGRAMITVDATGENSIVVIPGANSHLTISVVDAHRDVLHSAQVVLCQLEVPIDSVEAAFAIAKVGGAKTILNPAPAHELTPSLIQMCDIVMPNQIELAQLGGTTSLLSAGVSVVVITMGARGIRVVTQDNDYQIPPFAVRSLDSTGAGDAACGAFAAAIAAGADIAYAARRASAAGALAATKHGAVPSLPHAASITQLTQ